DGVFVHDGTGARLNILQLDPNYSVSNNLDDNTGLSFLDVPVNLDLNALSFDVGLHVKKAYALQGNFDLGIDGFGLGVTTKGGAELDFDVEANLGFGFSLANGFYAKLEQANGADLPEATIGVNAHLLPGTTLDLNLFGLHATATNHVDTTQPFASTI